MNKAGKTITIFLVVIVILLLCLSAICLYMYQKESEGRKSAEIGLEQFKAGEAKIQGDLKEAKKQVFLLEQKNKEADEKINDLMDNLELEQGLREEIKQENQSLKDALDNENQSKAKIRAELTEQLTAAQEKMAVLETELNAAKSHVQELEGQSQTLHEKMKEMELEFDKKLEQEATLPIPSPDAVKALEKKETLLVKGIDDKEVDLDKIVVAPTDIPEGRVLSVDKDNEFLIINLGEKEGVIPGIMMSVYRGKEYLGDVKISRVQPAISTADFIPPFSSQKVRKNDQVVVKK